MANGYRAGIPGAIPFIIGLVLWILGWVLPWIGAAGLLLMLVAGGLFAAAVWRRLGDVGRAPAVQRDE